MSLNMVQGLPGSGKSFTVTHWLMADFLLDSDRPIFTTIPLELEWYLPWLSRNRAKQEEMRGRIHFLRPGVVDRELEWEDEDGKVHKQRRRYDRIQEFWWEVEPNSVVFLDEAADPFSALKSKERPETLDTFIQHHRHYKLDLFFMAQDKEDVDIKIRSKCNYVYDLANSLTEPILPGIKALRGVKWPVQFFYCRVLTAKKVMGKRGDLERYEPVETRACWPTKRRFKNYRSFSQASTLRGMKAAGDHHRSNDIVPAWRRWFAFAEQMAPVTGLVVGAAVALCLIANLYIWLMMGFKGPWYRAAWDTYLGGTPQPAAVAAAVPSGGAAGSPVSSSVSGQKSSTGTVAVLRVKLVTPYAIHLSDGQSYRVGQAVPGGGVLSRVALNGVVVGTNELSTAAFLLRCSGRESSGGS